YAMENRFGGWMKRTPLAFRIAFGILIFAPGLVLGILWCVTNSGPHAWLVDFQARLIDSYYPTATALLTLTIPLVLTAGPIILFCFVINLVIPAPPSEEPPAITEHNEPRVDE